MRTGPEGDPDGSGGEPADLRIFRPQRGRAVAIGGAVTAILIFVVVAVALPGPGSGGPWQPVDRVLFALIGVAIAALLWRYATIQAVPTDEGLEVRNILRSQTVPWGSVEAVRFGGGEPWVTLDLDDADTVAVMAIQRADGERSVVEARRLATLVARLR